MRIKGNSTRQVWLFTTDPDKPINSRARQISVWGSLPLAEKAARLRQNGRLA